MKKQLLLTTLSAVMCLPSVASAKDYYVSINRGKGKKATKDKPAKDLGNIASKLAPGDVVHIAEGVYLGKGDSGYDEILVPVSVIGGYDDTFSKRDPWGKHKTILSGVNGAKNFKTLPRFRINLQKYRDLKNTPAILVDGLIVDHGARNYYRGGETNVISRKASPKHGKNPTPENGGIIISAGKGIDVTVQNCVVLNTAPTQGVLQVSGNKDSKVVIRNNLVVNNTGSGIFAGTIWRPSDQSTEAQFTIENNTVVFSWKHDPIASYGGNALKLDAQVKVVAKNNVLAFSDFYGLHNAANTKNVKLVDNLFAANMVADYLEFDSKIPIADIEDEAENLHDDTSGNVAKQIKLPVSAEFATKYAGRPMINRNAMEQDIKGKATGANALRGMLGLPTQAGTVKGPAIDVWLPRIALDDALKIGVRAYGGKYGCSKPAAK